MADKKTPDAPVTQPVTSDEHVTAEVTQPEQIGTEELDTLNPEETLVVDPVTGVPHSVYNRAVEQRDAAIAEYEARVANLTAKVVEQAATIEAFKKQPDMETFAAHIAAIAILAALRLADRFTDENDNEAQRQANGSVRLSIKKKKGDGHRRVFVRVPEKVDLLVVDAPDSE